MVKALNICSACKKPKEIKKNKRECRICKTKFDTEFQIYYCEECASLHCQSCGRICRHVRPVKNKT